MRILLFTKKTPRRFTGGNEIRRIEDRAIVHLETNPGRRSKAWIWHISVSSASEAAKYFRCFDRYKCFRKRNLVLPRMVVLENSHTTSIEESLDYLRDVLPIGAKLLEQFPRIGSGDTYGRTNAHGNPLDVHVAGICHSLPQHSVTELAALVDVYLPTRLVLNSSNLKKNNRETPKWNYYDWETVVENTDVLRMKTSDLGTKNNRKTWTDVWRAQARDHCKETYVLLDGTSRTVRHPIAKDALAVRNFFREFKMKKM